MSFLKSSLVTGFLVTAFASIGFGGQLVISLPDFNGPVSTVGFPLDLGVAGTFNYSLPQGAVITSATFSGTYGDAVNTGSTAPFDVDIFSADIDVCDSGASACWNGTSGTLAPFGFSLPASIFGSLSAGSTPYSVEQTNFTAVRLGDPTLTINFSTVPEPLTLPLMAFGLMSAALVSKKLRKA